MPDEQKQLNPISTPSAPTGNARSSIYERGNRAPMIITMVCVVFGLMASYYVYGLSLALEQEALEQGGGEQTKKVYTAELEVLPLDTPRGSQEI